MKKKIFFLKKIYFFLKKNRIFINYINLYSIYKINKNYNFKNYPTNILIFNYKSESNVFVCKLLLLKESIFLKKEKIFYFYYLIIHIFLHLKKIDHDNFYSNLIMNILKKKIINLLK